MERAQHIEAEVTLLPTQQGGLSRPVASGHRPRFYYGGDDWGAEQTCLGAELVRPGETVRAHISFLNPLAGVNAVPVRPMTVLESHANNPDRKGEPCVRATRAIVKFPSSTGYCGRKRP
jgi:hypothetical protein